VARAALKTIKVALSITLAGPATVILLPYMLPLAAAVLVDLCARMLGSTGGFHADDAKLMLVCFGGIFGLLGFWLWVFTDETRSIRMQRWMALFWLAGAAALTPYVPMVTFPPVGLSAWGFFATLLVIVGATLFALWLFASSFFGRRLRADLQSRK
jgi:hypothetical protein